MSREKEESSSLGNKPPKKKKKFLYLDRFEDHQKKADTRFKSVESRIGKLVFCVIILAIAVAGLGVLAAVML